MILFPFQRRIASFLFSLFIVVVTLPAGAKGATSSEEIPTLEPVVVTATKTEVPLAQAASSVTIIDRRTIEEKHLITVAEALREVPGLDIVQSGGLGGTASAFLHGGNSRQTLVLIDGVQANTATDGAFDFADLTTENIERIEIVRGPQSPLYGSNAIGGVIQIITRKGSGPPTPSVSFEAGSFKTFRETVGLSGGSGPYDYSLSATRLDTAGFSRAKEGSEKDGYQNTAFSSRFGVNLTEKSRVEWTARYTDSKVELDFCSETDDPNCIQKREMLVSALTLRMPISNTWSHQLKLSLNIDDLQFQDPDSSFSPESKINSLGERFDWRHDITLAPIDLLTLGYEYESQKGEIEGPSGFNERLTNQAFFAFNQFRPNPFILNLGIRHDDNSRFGQETTYKIETAYLFQETGSKIRLAYGTGFRGPTFNDLFFPGASNENLRPEKSRSWEAGVDQEFGEGTLRLEATYFRNHVKDLIEFDLVTFTPENLSRTEVHGTEVALSSRPSRFLMLRAVYTWMHTEDEETGAQLPRRPRRKAAGTIRLRPTDRFRLDLDFRYVGNRFNDTRNTVPISGYTIANLAATYDLTKKTQLFARVENLFDREYEEVSGYQTAGFSVFGGVKVTF